MKKYFLVLLLGMFLVGGVCAATDGYCVNAVVSDINPSSVGIDEEFTVGILIDGCGTESPEFVDFYLIDVGPYILIKEPLIKKIGALGYANSDRFLNYHMRSASDASPGNYEIKYRLIYGREGYEIIKDGSFDITVIADEAELGIASVKFNPVLPYDGDKVEITLRIENTGEGTAKSVEVYMEHPFQGLKQSFIGALDPDEDGPAILTFIVDRSGEFEFPVTISYKDDFGDNEIKTMINLNVLEKKSNIGVIILGISMIVIIAGGIYYFIKTKKAKDKIIQQLLKGNGSKEKSKK